MRTNQHIKKKLAFEIWHYHSLKCQAKHEDLSLKSLSYPDIHFISKSLHGSLNMSPKPLAASNFTVAVLAQDLIMSHLDFSNSNLKHLLFAPPPNHYYLIANGMFKTQVRSWYLRLKSLFCLAIHQSKIQTLSTSSGPTWSSSCLCITACLLGSKLIYLTFPQTGSTWPCLRDFAFVPSAPNNQLLGPCMVYFSSVRSHYKHSLNKRFSWILYFMPCLFTLTVPCKYILVVFLKDLSFSEMSNWAISHFSCLVFIFQVYERRVRCMLSLLLNHTRVVSLYTVLLSLYLVNKYCGG